MLCVCVWGGIFILSPITIIIIIYKIYIARYIIGKEIALKALHKHYKM